MLAIHSRLRAALCGAVLAGAAAAQTSDSIPCAADNTLYETIFGDASNGAGGSLFVGTNAFGSIRRALLRFDVASVVPPGSRILTARLDLIVTQTTVAAPFPMSGHRVTTSWGEGTSVASGGGGGGGAAAVGDATWLHRFWNTQLWATPGGDFVATPSFTASMPTTGAFSTNLSRAAAADVQAWLDNPASNFGWVLKAQNETLQSTAHRLNSREATGIKPLLVVTYLAPGQLGAYGTGCPTTGTNTAVASYSGSPAGGSTLTINKSQTIPNSVGADFFTLSLDPVGVALLPGCTAYLPLAEVISGNAFVTNAAGAGASTLTVPAGFPGFLINCQAVVLANNPLGFVLTNSALCVTQ
ncbi:MAG: DNRLRE domain-containing protein [Planctomycetota bacterium]